MGNKAIINTLLQKKSKNITIFNPNLKENIFLYQFSKLIENFFKKKKIWLLNISLNTTAKNFHVFLLLYYFSAKVNKYKENKKFSMSQKHYKKKIFRSEKFIKIFEQFSKTTTLIFNITILNKKVSAKLVNFFYTKLNQFSNSIFVRRFPLFIDFLKFSSLFYMNQLSSWNLLQLFALIFRFLSKRLHNLFLVFIKYFLQLIVVDILALKLKNCILELPKGGKFIVSGRLRGKPRGSTRVIKIGTAPTQQLDKNIFFTKIHCYTLFGVFGMKLWIYKH